MRIRKREETLGSPGEKGGVDMMGMRKSVLILFVCATAAMSLSPWDAVAGTMKEKGKMENSTMKSESTMQDAGMTGNKMMKDDGAMKNAGMTEEQTKKKESMEKEGMMKGDTMKEKNMMKEQGTMK
jgi:hypothetical protein